MPKIKSLEERINSLSKDDNLILDFFAPWCSPCKILNQTIEELMEDGYKVLKVNVDEDMDIAEHFNVSSVPVIVGFKNNEEIGRLNGLINKDSIINLFK